MQTSRWGFALTEMVHLVALALLGGAVLIVDLRLLGVILKSQPIRLIGRDLGRILLASLVVMVLTGIALLSEEAGKCYFSAAFRWKMALLTAAIVFYFSAHHRAVLHADEVASNIWTRSTAVVSLALWLGVGIAGRAVGLL
jgi:hypothetical protein